MSSKKCGFDRQLCSTVILVFAVVGNAACVDPVVVPLPSDAAVDASTPTADTDTSDSGVADAGVLDAGTVDAASGPTIDATTQITTGLNHTCVLFGDGTVWCWGSNAFGQLGDRTMIDRSRPTLVSGVSDAVQIAAAGLTTCARLADGTVRCWGDDTNCQLGVDVATEPRDVHTGPSGPLWRASATPVQVPQLFGAVSIALGDGMGCARLDSGAVRCWGRATSIRRSGLPGSPDVPQECHLSVADVPDVVSAVDLAVSHSGHACAVLSDGTVSCWDGTYGGYPDWASGWSAPASPVLQPMLSDVAQFVSLRSGDMPGPAECARLHDGTVTCRGNNDLGTLGDGASVPDMTTTERPEWALVPGLSGIVRLVWNPLVSRLCAERDDHALMCWGTELFTTTDERTALGPDRCQVWGTGLPAPSDSLPCSTRPYENSEHSGRHYTGFSIGDGFECAVVSGVGVGEDGVWCRGPNALGMLGTGTADVGSLSFQAVRW